MFIPQAASNINNNNNNRKLNYNNVIINKCNDNFLIYFLR